MTFTTPTTRRNCLARLLLGWGSTVAWSAHAEALDSTRLLAGFAPGGTVDTEARHLATRMAGSYAKSVFVDNRPGGGGQIAISTLKAAPADGSTLLVTPMSMLGIYPHTYRKLPYDPFSDLTPVSTVVSVDMAFVVGPLVPSTVSDIPQFMAWCKSNPAQANFGSPAPGSMPHFVGVLLGRAGGVDLRHIGYRGSQPAIMDLVGGQIAAVSAPVGEFLQHLPGGKLRVLASSGATRSKFLPHVATLLDQGYRTLVYGEWHGIFLPGHANPAVVKAANAAVRQALANKEVIDALAAVGLEVRTSTSEELATVLRSDFERWRGIVKSIGFTADD